MSAKIISIDPEQAVETVSTLAENSELTGDLAARLHAQGVWTGVAYEFRDALAHYVSDLKVSLTQMKSDLATLQESVTTTVAELGEQDAALADQSQAFMDGVLDDIGNRAIKANITLASGPGYEASKGIG